MTHTDNAPRSAAKKSGHSRNPMACTNCRARKIKCESNRQHPERPCQRCTTRKLHCEYVAISHPAQSPQNIDTTSSISDSPRRSHSRAPSSAVSTSQPRYSPVSSSFSSRRSSPRNDYEYLSPTEQNRYLVSHDFAPEPGSTPRYNTSYYPSANYGQPGVFTQSGNTPGHPNSAPRNSIQNGCYDSLNPPPPLVQGQIPYGGDYLAWNNGVASPSQNQLFLSSECRCTGMYCTCTNRRP